MAETEKKTKEEKNRAAAGALTAEDYRKKAQEHQDAIKDQWKIFGKVGIFLLAAAIALVILGIAWFASNQEVTATGMSVAAAPNDFELAAKGTEGNSTGAWDGMLSGLLSGIQGNVPVAGSENSSVAVLSTDSSRTSVTWAITDESNMGNTNSGARGIYPGASGKLTFYILAKKTGTLTLSLDLQLEGFGDATGTENLPIIGSELKDLLEGHILPIKSSLFSLKIKDFFNISSINISEEGAIGMDISLYLVRK